MGRYLSDRIEANRKCDEKDAIRRILANNKCFDIKSSLHLLFKYGYTTMFKRMMCEDNRSAPLDSFDVPSVVSSALKDGIFDVLFLLLELGVSLDLLNSSPYWYQCAHKDLCIEIAREKDNYPIHCGLRRFLPEDQLINI